MSSLSELAELAWSGGRYAEALDCYQELLTQGETDDPALALRVCEALGRCERWDEALEATRKFLDTHRETLWEARGLHWLGRLSQALPHFAYLDRCENETEAQHWIRGRGRTDDEPEEPQESDSYYLVFAGEVDLQAAFQAWEGALALYPRFRETDATVADEITLCIEFGSLLYSVDFYEQKRCEPAAVSLDMFERGASLSAFYPAHGTRPEKLLFLSGRVQALSKLIPLPSQQLFTFWLMAASRLHEAQQQIYWSRPRGSMPAPHRQCDLFLLEQALGLPLEEVDTDLRRLAQFLQAQYTGAAGDLALAISRFQTLASEAAGTPWEHYALSHLDVLQRAELVLGPTASSGMRGGMGVSLVSRNLPSLQYELYHLDLERWWTGEARGYKSGEGFPVEGLGRATREKRHTWTPPITAPGDPLTQRNEVPFPPDVRGAHLLVARANFREHRAVVLNSDLGIALFCFPARFVVVTFNSRTGVPVPGVRLLLRTQMSGRSGARRALIERATGPDGTLVLPTHELENASHVEILASHDGHLAVTPPRYIFASWRGPKNDDRYCGQHRSEDRVRLHCFTDRMIYRPGERVRWKCIALALDGQNLTPAVGETLQLKLEADRGQPPLLEAGTTSKFGTLHGEIEIPAESANHAFNVEVCLPASPPEEYPASADIYVDVQAYRPPGFRLQVGEAPAGLRWGDTVEFPIQVEAPFGKPLRGALVRYEIRPSRHRSTWPFAAHHPYLAGRPRLHSTADWDPGVIVEPLVAAGRHCTDENGHALVTFDSILPGAVTLKTTRFALRVEVTDAEGHTVSEGRSFLISDRRLSIEMECATGYGRVGEECLIRISTRTAAGIPARSSGALRIRRCLSNPDEPGPLVYEAAITTGSQGDAEHLWQPACGGYFQLSYEVSIPGAGPEAGRVALWVLGPELIPGEFPRLGLVLRPERPLYQPGEVARLLILAHRPGCSVLITIGDGIRRQHQLVELQACATEIELGLDAADVPGLVIRAGTFLDGQWLEDARLVNVLPERRLARVSLELESGECRPGESTSLVLRTRDLLDRPLSAEVSVAVTDAALESLTRRTPEGPWFPHDPASPDWHAPPSVGGGDSLVYAIPVRGEPDAGRELSRPAELLWPLNDLVGEVRSWPPAERLPPVRISPEYHPDPDFRANPREVRTDRWESAWLWAYESPGQERKRHYAPILYTETLQLPPPEPPGLHTRPLDTALWLPAVRTGTDGCARVEILWPNHPTEWCIRATAVGEGGEIGSAELRAAAVRPM